MFQVLGVLVFVAALGAVCGWDLTRQHKAADPFERAEEEIRKEMWK